MFETIIACVFAVAVGAAAGYFYAKNKFARDGQFVSEQTILLETAQAQVETLRQEVATEREKNAGLVGELHGLNSQLEFTQEQLAVSQDAEKQRLEHEKAQLARREEEKRREQEIALTEESKVLKALSPVQKNLDLLQQKVTVLEESRQKQMGMLAEQLQGLGVAQEKLDRETTALAAALRDNKIRGAWGEAQLKNIVEYAGLIEHVDFETQYRMVDSEGTQKRPDMVVNLPGDKIIPIDAKVPYSDYQRACEISDNASEQELSYRDELLMSHAKALRGHIDALAKRDYSNNTDSRVTSDFVIAFIPNESLLRVALEKDVTLMDYAFSKRVALTDPVTLWAILKSVALAWQQDNLSNQAQELFDLSRDLFKKLNVMAGHIVKLGNSLKSTVGHYNSMVGSVQRSVLPVARKLKVLDLSVELNEPQQIEDDKGDVRELTAAELISSDDEYNE